MIYENTDSPMTTAFGTYVGPSVERDPTKVLVESHNDFPLTIGTIALGLPVFLMPGSFGLIIAQCPEFAAGVGAAAFLSLIIGSALAYKEPRPQ